MEESANNNTATDPYREELIRELNRNPGLELAGRLSADELEAFLAARLNDLIRSDLNAVITILYRVDVDENKLKELLRTNAEEDTGRIMARLIIARQAQKIKTRKASGTAREASGTAEGDPEWMD